MGRNSIGCFILVTNIIAVINNGLRAVDEVARGLPLFLGVIGSGVLERLVGNSTRIQGGQNGVSLTRTTALAMLILGIDITTTHTRLHIDEVEFYDTCDITPVFFVKSLTGTLLRGQLQIDTRSEGHLVV